MNLIEKLTVKELVATRDVLCYILIKGKEKSFSSVVYNSELPQLEQQYGKGNIELIAVNKNFNNLIHRGVVTL